MSAPTNQSAFSLPGDDVGGPLHRFTHDAMACTWEIYVAGEDAAYAEQAARTAFDEADRVEQELSRFIEHSDISRINALDAGQSTCVGADACECLELALRIHAETNGAFDVTAGSLALTGRPTATAEPRFEIDRTRRLVTVRAGDVAVDVGGIGKGYAVDQVVAILRDWSIRTALVHAGQSTVYAIGNPPDRAGWTVAIRNPQDHSASLGVVLLRDRALSGSGSLVHGRHIVDPRTGQPATGPLGAWALAPSAAVSDALSTAFMVLSPDQVADYCGRHPEVAGLLWAKIEGEHRLLCYGTTLDRPHGA